MPWVLQLVSMQNNEADMLLMFSLCPLWGVIGGLSKPRHLAGRGIIVEST